MSLEALIKDLTAALEANTAALIGRTAGEKNKTAAKTETKPVIGADQKVIDSAPLLNEKKDAPPADKAVTFDDVKSPFLALCTKNSAAAVAILQKHKAEADVTDPKTKAVTGKRPSLSAAKPEQFAAILADIQAALNG